MKKHFYSHIIETDSVRIKLTELEVTDEERKNLIELADSSLHHAVIDAVLSELSVDDKKIFMSHLDSDKHDEIWELLNAKVKDIEVKIKKTAEVLKEELHQDIDEMK